MSGLALTSAHLEATDQAAGELPWPAEDTSSVLTTPTSSGAATSQGGRRQTPEPLGHKLTLSMLWSLLTPGWAGQGEAVSRSVPAPAVRGCGHLQEGQPKVASWGVLDTQRCGACPLAAWHATTWPDGQQQD